MFRRSEVLRLLIGLALMLGLAAIPMTGVAAQPEEQGTINVTRSWVDGHEPEEAVEACYLITSDEAGSNVLEEICTSENSIVLGSGDQALETETTYYVWEEPGPGIEVSGDNPVTVVIPDTTGVANVEFENRQEGASVEVHQFACPAGFEGDDIEDYADACQQPRVGVEMSASGQGGYFVEGVTDTEGIVVFPGFTVPGEVVIAESTPTGDFADFVVRCEQDGTGTEITTSIRTNGIAAVAFDLPNTLVEAQALIRCDWYNIPAEEVPGLTFTIEPTSGTDGDTIEYLGEGYTPGGTVTVVMTGDGLIVDDTTADTSGAISGSFEAPARASLTGESTNDIPVWAIDDETGQESPRVTFTYVEVEPTATATTAPPTATATSVPPTATATTVPPTATATAAITATATVAAPSPTPVEGRVVQIQAGTCVDPSTTSIFPLNDPTIPVTAPQGAPEASVAEVSYTVIDISLNDLLATPHAINIFMREAGAESPLVCGEIGGPLRADGSIAIGLRELEGSGLTGIAYLSPNPANLNQTQISLFLGMGLAEEDPSLIPAVGDTVVIDLLIDSGPIAPEFQSGYQITIDGNGRADVVIRPEGSSAAIPAQERTADEIVRTVTLTNVELRALIANLHDIGFFDLTQAEDIDPRDQLIGGPSSLLTVTLVDGVWEVNANGLSFDETAVFEEAQRIIVDAVGGVEMP